MERWSYFLFVGCVLVVGWLLMGPQISRPTYGLVVRQGEHINTALENYKLDHKTYPDNLRMLVPEYLDSIEKPKLHGRQLRLQLLSSVKWEYSLAEDRKSYYVGITNGSQFGYDSIDKEWEGRPR